MKVGVGSFISEDPILLGRRSAEAAMASGSISAPKLAIAFCGSCVRPDLFAMGVREVTGKQTLITGGSAAGTMTRSGITCDKNSAALAILESPDIRFQKTSVGILSGDVCTSGTQMAERLSLSPEDRLFLLFYETAKDTPEKGSPPSIYPCTPLLEGISKVIGRNIPVIGAGLVADIALSREGQFCDFNPRKEASFASGVMISGPLYHRHCIMHGCTPLNGVYHTITHSRGADIFEIDNKPVIKIIDRMFGSVNWRTQAPVQRLSIGVNHGEKYGPFREEDFVNRIILGTLPKGRGIKLFEPDLKVGDQIQFMFRNAKKIVRSARENAEMLIFNVLSEEKTPIFGLYIDCAGRMEENLHSINDEAMEVISVFNKHDIPLLGFYSGMEIAPLLGKSRGLDWTGVLVVFAREGPP